MVQTSQTNLVVIETCTSPKDFDWKNTDTYPLITLYYTKLT
jgi:hypothetical protein